MDFLCQHENKIARTKTALNLLGLAPWKNTHLLGTSNVISFLLAPSHAVQSGWVNGAGNYHQQMSIMSMTIRDSLALFAVFGLNEKSNWGRDQTQGSNYGSSTASDVQSWRWRTGLQPRRRFWGWVSAWNNCDAFWLSFSRFWWSDRLTLMFCH